MPAAVEDGPACVAAPSPRPDSRPAASLTSLGFTRVVHADWSTAPGKRWYAEAHRTGMTWTVAPPRLVGSTGAFVDALLAVPHTLAGFDFPIGLPAAFGRRTGLVSFVEGLMQFGAGEWSRFFDVCERPEEIGLRRPFYPRTSQAMARQADLVRGLGVDSMDALRRQCERATDGRRAACSLFWTLGGNQVGKAAIAGWREVVQPARRKGARLWPFDGTLPALAAQPGLVVCETYPAEAYRHVDVRFAPRGSKRRQEDRRRATAMLEARCHDHAIELADDLRRLVADGFGSRAAGEDPFDAVVGLLGMIEVVDGRRPARPPTTSDPEWEGWILGQAA